MLLLKQINWCFYLGVFLSLILVNKDKLCMLKPCAQVAMQKNRFQVVEVERFKSGYGLCMKKKKMLPKFGSFLKGEFKPLIW